ncbi:DUF3710 domain-containing protein [Nocardioides ultimimeridianus]
MNDSDDSGTAAADRSAPSGPYDVEDLTEDGIERVDLGSLLIAPFVGNDLRLQVDEQTGEVRAVLLAGEQGAVELRAFAAPRNGDLWGEIRPQIAAETSRLGGTATEREGRFGTELLCELTVQQPDGTPAQQVSRVVGVNGSRWLLRATFLGAPALDAEAARPWDDAVAQVAVRRGGHAMPVGEPLALKLPEGLQQVEE